MNEWIAMRDDIREGIMETADLDESTLTSYLSDLMTDAEEVSVYVKDAPEGDWRASARLGEVHAALLNKHIWAAQISYGLQERRWVDTLLVGPGSTRMIRVQDHQSVSA